MVYARMSYVVKSEGAFSAVFRCLIGLLTGDTASPGFWNVYFTDFQLPHDAADIYLNGRPVCQLEQADDEAMFSTKPPSLQTKMDIFYGWSRRKFMFISPPKSKCMIFGPLPATLPVFRIGAETVEIVPKYKYVGMWFTSTHPNIFAAHYAEKASKARRVANAMFAAVKTHLGSLPVREGLQLYMARVDCYLISGGEISLDVDSRLLEEHLQVQQSFLRSLLGLNRSSILAILYTETGQTPIKIQDRVVRDALLDSFSLYRSGKACWIGDICLVLSRLPSPVYVTEDDLRNPDTVNDIMDRVEQVLDEGLQNDIESFSRTHLLKDRAERIDEGEGRSRMGLVTRRRRHYLDVPIPSHRKALTRLILSDHNLSVERLRYPGRYRAAAPRHLRLCRFCRVAVEDEAHALLVCIGDSGFDGKWNADEPYEFLKWMLSQRKITVRLAKFVADLLDVYNASPRYVPAILYIHG
ncbi:hypothetical protein C8F04DRAFT_1211219 [Mycena alexandri]|uniref:Uncharacterized protein n=1 Tax=Mycena alexandri TaxID=1745969 RepID=A0AAD6SRS2_9AGAR|nr:hypothetical protein C8F04DRAFT_1211219 [Mycena alexandri]